MRNITLAALLIGTFAAAVPARAQTFDPSYPVCMHVYGRADYYECRYGSLPQCQMSAAGRAAQCMVNPYFAQGQGPSPLRRHKRYRHAD